MVFYNFLDFLYLAWLSRYTSMIENNFSHQWRNTIVAIEHAIFKFYDLKVASHHRENRPKSYANFTMEDVKI